MTPNEINSIISLLKQDEDLINYIYEQVTTKLTLNWRKNLPSSLNIIEQTVEDIMRYDIDIVNIIHKLYTNRKLHSSIEVEELHNQNLLDSSKVYDIDITNNSFEEPEIEESIQEKPMFSSTEPIQIHKQMKRKKKRSSHILEKDILAGSVLIKDDSSSIHNQNLFANTFPSHHKLYPTEESSLEFDKIIRESDEVLVDSIDNDHQDDKENNKINDENDIDNYGSDFDEIEEIIDDSNISASKVKFVEPIVTDVIFIDKVPKTDLSYVFFTNEESMKFEYEYSKELERAEVLGMSWMDWMNNRTDDDIARDEAEEQFLHDKNDSYDDEHEFEFYSDDTSDIGSPRTDIDDF